MYNVPSGNMVFGFFKDADEHFEKAQEYIRQKEYDKARKSLNDAIEKNFSKSDLAFAMVKFIELGESLNNRFSYERMGDALSKLEGTFEFGLSTFVVSDLRAECEAMAVATGARNLSDSALDLRLIKGESMIDAAKVLQVKVGEKVLMINEYFNGNQLTGNRLALGLLAEGNEIVAESTFHFDPKKAAEYQQIAYNFRRQMGQSGDMNKAKIAQYTKTCTCWICGRIATGQGLHFVKASASVSPQMLEEESMELSPSAEDLESIFICKACYTSISRRADEISEDYYKRSQSELEHLKNQMLSEIARLDARITSVGLRR